MSESTTLDSTQLEKHRSALTGHCYRMLGSPDEADDAVQETLVRAWRNLERFEQRSSLKTWLYSIATRVCLDALADRARRVRPMELGAVGTVRDELCTRPAAEFIEPIPESRCFPRTPIPPSGPSFARASGWRSWRRSSICRRGSERRCS